MKFVFQFLICSIMGVVLVNSSFAGGSKRTKFNPIVPTMKVTEVDMPSENALAGGWKSSVSCPKFFKGTHAGNEITVKISATGGDGDYNHSVTYYLTKGYKRDGKVNDEQLSETRSGNGTISIKLPELEEDVPFVQQDLFLITTDSRGQSASTSITFTVSRPVVLFPSSDSEITAQDCFQRYPVEETNVSVLSNGSTAPSNIQISQGIQKSWSSTKGWQSGVFISPLSWLGLGNLLSLNMSYFSQISKQTTESFTITSGYTLNPGDYLQVYVQPTRYITHYDATLVDPCGSTKKMRGAYMFQKWGFAYQVNPVNPYSTNRTLKEAVGAPPVNTCPKELSPMNDVNSDSTVTFRKTN